MTANFAVSCVQSRLLQHRSIWLLPLLAQDGIAIHRGMLKG